MGIIISCFTGCGREFLKNTHGDKAKIFDAVAEMPLTDIDGKINGELLESYFNKVMSVVDDNDIVFVDASTAVRDKLNENNVDYDIFYPSAERRGEFIENQVRKRTNPKIIRSLDKDFEKWVTEIDDDESPNCYKHKLNNQGEFIGNAPIIMQYINSLKPNEQARTMENNS
jgi:hypothetical protein